MARADIAAPFAGLAANAATTYLTRRFDRGGEILKDEFSRRSAHAADLRDADQLAAAAIRYTRAIKEQAADENLYLLAQAMLGCARRHELWASDFLMHADVLASLTRDELLLIGLIMAEDKRWNEMNESPDARPTVWHMVTSSALAGIFPDDRYVQSVAARAQRSGYILALSGWGSMVYELSPIGREVRDLVDIEAALQRGS